MATPGAPWGTTPARRPVARTGQRWSSTWDRRTPLDAALREDANDIADWLRHQGARTAGDGS
jgi:hypothetical protein